MNDVISIILIVGAVSIGPLEAPPVAQTTRDACLLAMAQIGAKDHNLDGKESWFVRDFPGSETWLHVYCIPAPDSLPTG